MDGSGCGSHYRKWRDGPENKDKEKTMKSTKELEAEIEKLWEATKNATADRRKILTRLNALEDEYTEVQPVDMSFGEYCRKYPKHAEQALKEIGKTNSQEAKLEELGEKVERLEGRIDEWLMRERVDVNVLEERVDNLRKLLHQINVLHSARLSSLEGNPKDSRGDDCPFERNKDLRDECLVKLELRSKPNPCPLGYECKEGKGYWRQQGGFEECGDTCPKVKDDRPPRPRDSRDWFWCGEHAWQRKNIEGCPECKKRYLSLIHI